MSNHSGRNSGATPWSFPANGQYPRKYDKQHLVHPLDSHRRSVSRSTTDSSEFRLSAIASERSQEEESQTDISTHDQEDHDEHELNSKPLGKPSRRTDDFAYPTKGLPDITIQQGFDQDIEAIKTKSNCSYEKEHPEAVGILRETYGDEPDEHYFLDCLELEDTREKLIDRLFKTAVKSCGPDSSRHNQSFYPPTDLVDLLDDKTVHEELRRCGRWTEKLIEKFTNTICTEQRTCLPCGKEVVKSFRPIFALLVLTERLEWIGLFLADEISNLDLPLVSVLNEDGSLKTLQRESPSDRKDIRCFSRWPLHRLKEFSDLQWQFIAHRFRCSEYNDVATDDLHELSVLPFIKPIANCGCTSSDGVVSLGEGGSGLVMKCFIHPDFHDFPDADDIIGRGVAVKRLKMATSDTVFKRELKILGKFCGDGAHEHVVPLLGSYRQSGYHHLVFPLAEMNLFEYWKQHRTAPPLGYDGMVWIAKQCAGVTDALHEVHRHKTFSIPIHMQQLPQRDAEAPNMRRGSIAKGGKAKKNRGIKSLPPNTQQETTIEGLHGDVKPENLLLFLTSTPGDRGAIKLSDFGEAEMTPSARGSRSRPNAAVTLTYRAPECDLRPDSVRPASDVWSLGCVFLELITWALGGFDYVNQFARRRITDDIFDDGANVGSDTFFELATSVTDGQTRLGLRVKPEVFSFIEELHTHKRCTNFLHELLDLIQDRTLLVDSTHRKCDFKSKLQSLHKKCQEDKLYATEPRPRKRVARSNTLVELRDTDVEERQSGKISFNMNRLRKHQGPTKRSERGKDGAAMWKPRVSSF